MKRIILGLVALAGLFALCPAPVLAFEDPLCQDTAGLTAEQIELLNCNNDETVCDKIPGAVSAIFATVGIVAVGVIIFGGVRYSLSRGDPGKVKQAKDTIMYAVIGLIVTLLAFTITTFIVGNVL